MKNHLISTLLFTATYVLSKGTDGVNSSPSESLHSIGYKEPGESLGTEGDFFRLILEGKTDKKQCEDKLKGYCKKLKEVDPHLDRVSKKIKDLCQDAEKSCSTYLDETEKTCTKLQEILEQRPLTPTYFNCSNILPDCLLLDGFCSDNHGIRKKCQELLDRCHDKALQNVYDEIFLKEFAAWLYSYEFEKKFKDGCLHLRKHGEGFMRGCLNWTRTHERLQHYHHEKCEELHEQIESVLTTDGYLGKSECDDMNRKCHDYGQYCKNGGGGQKNPRCSEINQRCSGMDYVFKPPSQEELEKLSLYDRLDIKTIFKRALEYEGLILGPPPTDMNSYELLFWLLNHWDPHAGIEKCPRLRDPDVCPLINYYSEELGRFCNYGSFFYHGPQVCSTIKERIYAPLSGQRYIIRGFLEGRGVPSEYIPWLKLHFGHFSHEDCYRMTSHCTFLTTFKENGKSFGTLCDNFKHLCYRNGRRDGLDLLLAEQLIRYLFEEQESFTEKRCIEWVFTDCEFYEHGFFAPEQMDVCAYPLKTCERLKKIIDKQCADLQVGLLHQDRNVSSCKHLSSECSLLSTICNQRQLSECSNLKATCSGFSSGQSIKTRRDFMRGALYQRQN